MGNPVLTMSTRKLGMRSVPAVTDSVCFLCHFTRRNGINARSRIAEHARFRDSGPTFRDVPPGSQSNLHDIKARKLAQSASEH